jgi:hypothetical protein
MIKNRSVADLKAFLRHQGQTRFNDHATATLRHISHGITQQLLHADLECYVPNEIRIDFWCEHLLHFAKGKTTGRASLPLAAGSYLKAASTAALR